MPEGLKGKSSFIKEDQKLKAKLEGKKGKISLKWTNPGGTAIPGRSAAKVEQAPSTSPSAKTQFNIVDPTWGLYQIVS